MTEKQIKTISLLDPSIDWVATPSASVVAFLRKRDNHAVMLARANEALTVYTLRVIPHEVATGYIAEKPTDEAKFLAAFRASLWRVENGYAADGTKHPAPWQPQAVRDAEATLARKSSLLSNDEVEEFDAQTVQDIGAVAWSRYCFFQRGTVLRWLLPQSVQDTWGMVRSRFLAEQDASTAGSGTTG